MRCPHCGAEVADPGAAFCSRCGRPLGTPDSEATVDLGAGDTAEIDKTPTPPRDAPAAGRAGPATPIPEPARGAAQSPLGPSGGLAPLRDSAAALRRSIAAAWLDAAGAAAIAFLGVLLIGALGVVALKLDEATVGATANPLDVLISSVLVALASLRVPIHAGTIGEITILPLGALVLAGAVLMWSARAAVRRREAPSLGALATEGAKIGVPFALICWASALVFGFRSGSEAIAADAGVALVLGGFWGASFGALGGLTAHASIRALVRAAAAGLRQRSEVVYTGVVAGATMLGIATLLALLALLLWIIVGLARGAPSPGFGARDAVAAVLYLVLFVPNVVVALIALGMGAPIDVGVLFNFRRGAVGPFQEFSLLDWGGGAAPWYLYALVLIPALGSVGAGLLARRRAGGPTMAPVLAVAALVVAITLSGLAWLGEASLGAGLVRNRGVGRVAPDAGVLFVAALAWAGAGGALGWKIGERRAAHPARKEPEA